MTLGYQWAASQQIKQYNNTWRPINRLIAQWVSANAQTSQNIIFCTVGKRKCTDIQMTKLYTRFVRMGKRKCTSFKVQNTLKLSKFLCSKYVRECTSMNTQHLKHIVSIRNTWYEQLKLYTIIIWMIALFHWSWGATIVPLARVMDVLWNCNRHQWSAQLSKDYIGDGGRTTAPMVTARQK